jgi:hypothetical protein
LPPGAIVRIARRSPAVRDSDRRIAEIAAANGARYSVELHQAAQEGVSAAFAGAHVRRLEAIRRRIGGVDRHEDGSWSVPPDYVELARRYEALRAREAPVEVEPLSPLPLERLALHDGATWLDRELVSPTALPRDQGFGREVRSAMAARRAWLVEQGFALVEGDGPRFRPDMIAVLERRELQRVAAAIAAETGLKFAPAEPGARLEGTVRRRLELGCGRLAMIESGREFALVPWRPVLDLNRRVSGVVRRDRSISWTIGRERGLDV